jgi:hypothetical protein
LKKLKVCPLGFSFGRHLKLSKLGLVQGRRQGLLPGLVNSMETVGSKDGSIKRGRRLHRRRPIRRVPTIEAPASFMGDSFTREFWHRSWPGRAKPTDVRHCALRVMGGQLLEGGL